MRNKLGMPTLLELDTIEKNAQLCRELGLDFIEINLNFPYCNYIENSPLEVKKILEANGIFATIHMPEELNLASFHRRIRESHITLFEDVCIWGEAFNCRQITFHLNDGITVTMPSGKVQLHDLYFNQVKENLEKSFLQLATLTKKHDLSICLENTSFTEQTEQLFNLATETYGLGCTFDIGHDAKNGGRAGAFYSKHPNVVKHMHIHDYNGKSDHLELFEGHLNITEFLKFAEERSILSVIEVKSVESLRASVTKLVNL